MNLKKVGVQSPEVDLTDDITCQDMHGMKVLERA